MSKDYVVFSFVGKAYNVLKNINGVKILSYEDEEGEMENENSYVLEITSNMDYPKILRQIVESTQNMGINLTKMYFLDEKAVTEVMAFSIFVLVKNE